MSASPINHEIKKEPIDNDDIEILSDITYENENRNDYDINNFYLKSQDEKKKSDEVERETKTKIDV